VHHDLLDQAAQDCLAMISAGGRILPQHRKAISESNYLGTQILGNAKGLCVPETLSVLMT
jgi:hypothetical protein